MSLMGAIVGLNEIHNQYEESVKASRVNQSALDLGLLINNSRHFSLNTPEVIKEIKVSSID
jgi:hypothetical protein